jgi:hypothetical protein
VLDLLLALIAVATMGATSAGQAGDPVADALRGLPAAFPDLAVVSVLRHENSVTAIYDTPGRSPASRPPNVMHVTVESHDTDAAAEAGRRWSVTTTPTGSTRAETTDGIEIIWWGNRRALGLIGRHVVNVHASEPAAERLVLEVFRRLVADLRSIRPARPARPWAIQTEDVVTLSVGGTVGDAIAREDIWRPSKGVAYDLNADGTDDYVVQAASGCGTGGCPYAIVNGRTGRSWGRVQGSPLVIRAETTRGLPDIESYSHASADSGTFTRWSFDGDRYVETSRESLAGDVMRARVARLAAIPRWRPGR